MDNRQHEGDRAKLFERFPPSAVAFAGAASTSGGEGGDVGAPPDRSSTLLGPLRRAPSRSLGL
jgi:hypothetical protein